MAAVERLPLVRSTIETPGGLPKRFGTTGWTLFSLKGWNKIAQGDALGPSKNKGPSPERGATRAEPGRCYALSGLRRFTTTFFPRALPWAVLLRPFGARTLVTFYPQSTTQRRARCARAPGPRS